MRLITAYLPETNSFSRFIVFGRDKMAVLPSGSETEISGDNGTAVVFRLTEQNIDCFFFVPFVMKSGVDYVVLH